MDRKIVYAGQIPLETDLLGTNQNAMVGLGKLAAAIFGTGGMVNGLAVGPNTPAALNVVVSPGEIYQLANLEATAYSSLPADTNHTVVKQGILLDAQTLACPAPTTAGFSQNFLIEATYADVDNGPTVLPYYNASNPSQAFSGPGGNGASQATNRAGQVQLQVKAGIAATTGSQVTPAVDSGYIALAVVTVANGQTSITAANIAAVKSGQILGASIATGRLLNVQTFTASGTYNASPGTNSVIVAAIGAGGGGGGVPATSSSQQATASGGLSGNYIKALLTANFAGGVPVTIGAAGASGNPGATGGTGGNTTFNGTAVVAQGGAGGFGGSATGATAAIFTSIVASGDPTTTGMLVEVTRGASGVGASVLSLSQVLSGTGGDSPWGRGGRPVVGTPGNNGVGYGAGGSGASGVPSQGGALGGGGSAGRMVIFEFG